MGKHGLMAFQALWVGISVLMAMAVIALGCDYLVLSVALGALLPSVPPNLQPVILRRMAVLTNLTGDVVPKACIHRLMALETFGIAVATGHQLAVLLAVT